MKTAVIGSGAWGTALAIRLCKNGHDVTMWTYDKNLIPEMEVTRRNPRLPGAVLPEGLKISGDYACAAGAKLVVMASPSFPLRSVSRGVAPYIDEDAIDGDTYVCPACGTINPLTATACTHCGRNKARALLLLAKNKIKQSPPVKRKQQIIPAPTADLETKKAPTLDEFVDELNAPVQEEKPVAEKEPEKEQQADFSGPSRMPYQGGYAPYPYPPYPYPAQPGAVGMPQYPTPGFFMGEDGKPYQMPPIVQPVAFVPYVTQEQPLMQYVPQEQKPQKAQPVQNKKN